MRFVKDGSSVSLWTVEGRMIVPVTMGEHQRRLMAFRKGEVDLCLVRGKWFLAATCDIPETDEFVAEIGSASISASFRLPSTATARSIPALMSSVSASASPAASAGFRSVAPRPPSVACASWPARREIPHPHQPLCFEGDRADCRTHRSRDCAGRPDAYPQAGYGPAQSAIPPALLGLRATPRVRRLQG
jgi:hypothetical protein